MRKNKGFQLCVYLAPEDLLGILQGYKTGITNSLTKAQVEKGKEWLGAMTSSFVELYPGEDVRILESVAAAILCYYLADRLNTMEGIGKKDSILQYNETKQ
jgi:hypothetical protein